MEILLIVIIGIVVSVIAAATKKRPKSSGQQDEPARPTMTDIQRAFMMAKEEGRPPQPQAYAPRAPVMPAYEPQVSATPVSSLQSTITESYPDYSGEGSLGPFKPYAGAQISGYFMDEEDKGSAVSGPVALQQRSHTAKITLFEDQRDIVKAVIYSEILSPKGRRAH